MKIQTSKRFVLPVEQGMPRRQRRQESGFAVLVVFILMILMFGLVIQSGLVLRGLRQELRLLEKRQAAKYQVLPVDTNAAPAHATSAPNPKDHGPNQDHQ